MAIHSQRPLRGLALCAGVGGLELGIHIAEPNYKTVCFVERESFPASVLVARMEDKALDQAPIWSDVTTFDGKPWRGKVSSITGGYPCQPFSHAGKKLGDKDPRHLWPHIKRIVDEIEPEWCFFENVEGHLTLGADVVIEDLQRMGFTVKAGLFSALECGASQIRRRIFIMAHANRYNNTKHNGNRIGNKRLEDASGSTSKDKAIQYSGLSQNMDDDMELNASLRPEANKAFQLPIFAPAPFEFATWGDVIEKRPDLQPCFLRLDDGVADWVERSATAGNGVVSLVAAYAWRTLKAAHLGE